MIELDASNPCREYNGVEFYVGEHVYHTNGFTATIRCFKDNGAVGLETDTYENDHQLQEGREHCEPDDYTCRAGHGYWADLEYLRKIEAKP